MCPVDFMRCKFTSQSQVRWYNKNIHLFKLYAYGHVCPNVNGMWKYVFVYYLNWAGLHTVDGTIP